MKKKSISKELVTKGFLREELVQVKLDLLFEMDKRFEDSDKKTKEYKDELLNKLDFLVSDAEKSREDREIGAHQTRELEERVDNHDKRIKKLETHL